MSHRPEYFNDISCHENTKVFKAYLIFIKEFQEIFKFFINTTHMHYKLRADDMN